MLVHSEAEVNAMILKLQRLKAENKRLENELDEAQRVIDDLLSRIAELCAERSNKRVDL